MYSRISSTALVIVALAGCSGPAPEVAEEAEKIACALDGAAEFSPTCTVESQIVPGGTILVIRHPGGGFRRFEIEGDWVRTADGVDLAVVTVLPHATEVTVGTDRYRLPPPAPPVNAPRP